METKKRIRLLMAALLSLSGVLPAAATDYQASDYLPLAVGNSWTYEHKFNDNERRYGDRSRWSTYTAQFPERPQFTITVERTEVIDGKTYYVISDMPANWPPAPPHFIVGKKLRWEGTHLMERTADGEEAIYRFDGANETGYAISTDEGANQFAVEVRFEPVPRYTFDFLGFEEGGWRDQVYCRLRHRKMSAEHLRNRSSPLYKPHKGPPCSYRRSFGRVFGCLNPHEYVVFVLGRDEAVVVGGRKERPMRIPAFLLRDFERLFNGGYDEHGNYDAGTVFVGDTATVANGDPLPEV